MMMTLIVISIFDTVIIILVVVAFADVNSFLPVDTLGLSSFSSFLPPPNHVVSL